MFEKLFWNIFRKSGYIEAYIAYKESLPKKEIANEEYTHEYL